MKQAKIYRKSDLQGSKKQNSELNGWFLVQHELLMLADIDHPNIYKIHETYEDESKIYIVINDMYQTTLYDKILNEGQLSDHDAAAISSFLASIVRYLHKKNIIIRNLRPDLILIDTKDILEVKLFDLSLAIEGGDTLLNRDVYFTEFRRLSSNF